MPTFKLKGFKFFSKKTDKPILTIRMNNLLLIIILRFYSFKYSKTRNQDNIFTISLRYRFFSKRSIISYITQMVKLIVDVTINLMICQYFCKPLQ